jgi:4-hydroxy-3-polyprenylbenzoate decarboxylase
MKKFVIAITGASGICYAIRLFDFLKSRAELHIIFSERGAELLSIESELSISYFEGENSVVYKNSKMNSSIASGSFSCDGMVVIPASMGTVGRIASGVSSSLVERAADVALKEKNKLILVPRESPFSTIHLKNLLALDQAGARIVPANPGFYFAPKSIDDIIDFVVAKVLDQLDVKHDLTTTYKP